MRILERYCTRLLVCVVLMAGSAICTLQAQDMVEIGPTKDNTLYEDAFGSFSNGSGSYFFAGATATGFLRRGLLQFDIAGAVPEGASIDSVELMLHMSKTIYSATS